MTNSQEFSHKLYLQYRGRKVLVGKALKERIAKYMAMDDDTLTTCRSRLLMFADLDQQRMGSEICWDIMKHRELV